MDNGTREPEYLTLFLCFILALLGGTAKELSKMEECFEWRRFFSNVFVSGFCGILIGLFSPEFEHKNLIMFAAGISGVCGIAFLDFCVDVLKTIITKSVDINLQQLEKRQERDKDESK